MARGEESGIVVRAIQELPDLREAVRLQKEIWGFGDVDLLPLRFFVVATKVGGQVFGAFDGDRMVGFLLAIPGIKPGPGTSYLHSHMMGVAESHRNRGVGRILKLRQREEALARDLDLIEWTFDPLELKNAFFNIERLGVIVRRYVFNQYGTTTSELHGGLPTDRCIAEWCIRSSRVESVLARTPEPRDIQARIEVPLDITQLRRSNPPVAREIQSRMGQQFQEEFDRGRAVIGFETTGDAGVYLLGPWHSA